MSGCYAAHNATGWDLCYDDESHFGLLNLKLTKRIDLTIPIQWSTFVDGIRHGEDVAYTYTCRYKTYRSHVAILLNGTPTFGWYVSSFVVKEWTTRRHVVLIR